MDELETTQLVIMGDDPDQSDQPDGNEYPDDQGSDDSASDAAQTETETASDDNQGPTPSPVNPVAQRAFARAVKAKLAKRQTKKQALIAKLRARFMRGKYGHVSGEELMGFGLPKGLKKSLNIKNLNKIAKIAGPIAIVAFPEAAPFIVPAMAVINAAAKNDPEAIAKIAATQAAAATGDPAALQALDALKAASSIKKQVQATNLLKAAQSGDVQALAKIEAIKAAKEQDPQAAASFEALQSAAKGASLTPDVVKAARARIEAQARTGAVMGCDCGDIE